MTEEEVFRRFSGPALAYLGDSVMDLMIKSYFLKNGNMQAEKYHKKVTAIVNARSQAVFAENIQDRLTETEKDIYRRGRNASVHTHAKNATLGEYKKATGLEALFGYLYLTGQQERMESLILDLIRSHGEDHEL